MIKKNIKYSLELLINYLESERFKGYDPYDTLNSWFPLKHKWPAAIATQIQKRNPINIRPLLGIKKEINPKAFGLFLYTYSILYSKTKNEKYLERANYFFKWLGENFSKGYSGYCWGYNFSWANPKHMYKPYTPSSVVTGFVCRGIYEYWKITDSRVAKDILISASQFILKDIPSIEYEEGICFSYTPMQRDLCFNASLLAAEILARAYIFTGNNSLKQKVIEAVNWVILYQKTNGSWNYSINIHSQEENQQIDFHQGYVIDSIYEIKKLLKVNNEKWEKAIENGLIFYKNTQFSDSGVSCWRYPKKWPIEIHNQAQGIITFMKLAEYNDKYKKFAQQIANWTIDHMQGKDGHFYYQKFPLYTNKISYMRWSNAWMFLALSYLDNFNLGE